MMGQRVASLDEPSVPRVEIDLDDRIVEPISEREETGAMELDGAPEVADVPAEVVDRLDAASATRASEKHRGGPGERLAIGRDVAERLPHLRRDDPLAAEVWEGGAEASPHAGHGSG